MSERTLAVTPIDIPGQEEHYGRVFPLAYLCQSEKVQLEDAVTWARSHRSDYVAQAAEHGAVFFRGLPLVTAEDFDAFVAAFGLPSFTYDRSLSNAVRINHTPRVFSANEAPPEVDINLHHEMAQTPIYPSKLFFFCQKAPDSGGASSICRSDILWQRIVDERPAFARACEEKGLKYTHTMPPIEDASSGMGRSWKNTLGVQTREGAEARLGELGYSWKWLEEDALRVTTDPRPAVRKLDSGRTAFFNQLIAAFTGWKDSRNDPSKAILFGDETPMDVESAQQVVEWAEQLSFDVPWQVGDVAIVDNFVSMHGRRTYRGSRSLLASFVH